MDQPTKDQVAPTGLEPVSRTYLVLARYKLAALPLS